MVSFFTDSIDIHMGINSESMGLGACSDVYSFYSVQNYWSDIAKDKEKQYSVQWEG